MPEHQIVISLKPEQFEQVQRMARAAGSKSVGTFVRQQFLAALGIEPFDVTSETGQNPNWKNIAGQIRRVHRELQVFIAESTSIAEYADEHGEFTFAGEPFPQEDGQKSATPANAPPEHVPPVSEPAAKELFDAAQDEMEQLAEKAFAISPRLGVLETERSVENNYADPLNALLAESLLLERTLDDDELEEEEELYTNALLAPGQEAGASSEQNEAEADAENEDEQILYESSNIDDDSADARTDEVLQDPDDSTTSHNSIPLSGGPPPRKRRT